MEASERMGKRVYKSILVVDLEDFSLSSDFRNGVQEAASKINHLANLYPDTSDRIFVINAPWYLRVIVAAGKAFVHPITAAKVVCVGTDWKDSFKAEGLSNIDLPNPKEPVSLNKAREAIIAKGLVPRPFIPPAELEQVKAMGIDPSEHSPGFLLEALESPTFTLEPGIRSSNGSVMGTPGSGFYTPTWECPDGEEMPDFELSACVVQPSRLEALSVMSLEENDHHGRRKKKLYEQDQQDQGCGCGCAVM